MSPIDILFRALEVSALVVFIVLVWAGISAWRRLSSLAAQHNDESITGE